MTLGRFVQLTEEVYYKKTDLDKGTIQANFREEGKVLHVVFRGSDQSIDWWNHLLFVKTGVPYGNDTSKVRMHLGWVTEYKESARNVVHARVKEFLKRVPDGQIYVSGHSYGGALSIVCSIDIQYNFGDVVKCIALASPRVGNRAFVKSFKKRVPSFSAYYGADIVHAVPPVFFGYRHIEGMNHFGKRKFFAVIGNTFRVLWWVIKGKPMQISDMASLPVILSDHHFNLLPADLEVTFK